MTPPETMGGVNYSQESAGCLDPNKLFKGRMYYLFFLNKLNLCLRIPMCFNTLILNFNKSSTRHLEKQPEQHSLYRVLLNLTPVWTTKMLGFFLVFAPQALMEKPHKQTGRPKTSSVGSIVSPLFAGGGCVGRPSTCWEQEQKHGLRGVEPTPVGSGVVTDLSEEQVLPVTSNTFL